MRVLSSRACFCAAATQVVRESQEQQAVLERSHGIKVQHIQREYQEFMEVRVCVCVCWVSFFRAWAISSNMQVILIKNITLT